MTVLEPDLGGRDLTRIPDRNRERHAVLANKRNRSERNESHRKVDPSGPGNEVRRCQRDH